MSSKILATCLAMGMSMEALAGCENVDPPSESAVDRLADTTYPAPLAPADKVNWQTAATPTAGTDPRSDFMRAQHIMSQLAAAAYRDQAEFDERIRPLGLYGVHVSAEAGLFGASKPDAYIGFTETAKMYYVAIRGTLDANDWLTDFFASPTFPTRYGNAPITLHQGFAIYADAIYEKVRSQLTYSCGGSSAEERTPLWITGHSLGAAAASIVAYRLAQDGCNVAGVSLFGTPRPGLVDFQQAYMAPTVLAGSLQTITQRWVHKQDPFYCMPPGGAWKHVGIENRIDGGLHLGTNFAESQCTTPEEWVGKLKTALEVSGIAPGAVAAQMHQALLDWLAGLINLSLACQPGTHWDDLWSLGGCSVVDTSHRVASVYNIAPADLLLTAVRLIYLAQHFPHNYSDAIGADFSDPVDPNVQWVKVRVEIAPPPWGEAPDEPLVVQDELTGGLCNAEIEPDGSQYCEFELPVGWTTRLVFWAPDIMPDAACKWIGADKQTTTCELTVTGEMTIGTSWQFFQ